MSRPARSFTSNRNGLRPPFLESGMLKDRKFALGLRLTTNERLFQSILYVPASYTDQTYSGSVSPQVQAQGLASRKRSSKATGAMGIGQTTLMSRGIGAPCRAVCQKEIGNFGMNSLSRRNLPTRFASSTIASESKQVRYVFEQGCACFLSSFLSSDLSLERRRRSMALLPLARQEVFLAKSRVFRHRRE